MNKLEKGIKVLEILNSNSFEAYIVGGAVRDYLLGIESNDIDITTNATSKDILNIFDNVELKGEKYLSFRIFYMDEEFEVTTFRKDIEYIDHRHPITMVAETIEEDLIRRDFTINAFAMNSKYEIIDLFNGKADLNNKLIKTIGKASVRFIEDGLRLLRALYFSSKLDFELDSDIIECFKGDYLSHLKEEYVKDMFFKIISFKNDRVLDYIINHNVFKNHPFYQQLAILSKKYNVTENLYALYLVINDNLDDCLITKKEKNNAKDICYFIKNEFSKISLFYGNINVIEEAINLWNAINSDNLKLDEVIKKYNELVIHSIKDINFDFNSVNQSKRSEITKILVYDILNGNVINESEYIKKHLGVD